MKKTIYILLLLLLLYCAYLFRAELQIRSDVNDNSFQFALITEQKQILDKIITGKTSFFYLFDNFNPRWNEGFSLNMYYPHLPQTAIALLGYIRILSLFEWFKLIKYLLLVLLPLSFYLAGRKLRFSYLQSFLAALFSQLIFTDGLYGIDLTSYAWRGWGLFSQQLAVFFLPLALAWTLNYLKKEDKSFVSGLIPALILNFLVAESHIGIFLMLVLCYPLFTLINVVASRFYKVWINIKRLFILGFSIFLLLSYFLIPFFLYSSYRNFSYWDPLWKFNSFGWFQTLSWFFSGAFFDFNRLPILTFIVIFGIFYYLGKSKDSIGGRGERVSDRAQDRRFTSRLSAGGNETPDRIYRVFIFLIISFVVYFILFFGRADLGKLLDLVPGLSEFHIHRFIVMVQTVAVFIAAGFAGDIIEKLKPKKGLFLAGLSLIAIFVVYGQKPIIKYINENNQWLKQDGINYQKDLRDYENLVKKMHSLPFARVYAGRPGNWGRNLKIGGTQIYMALAKDGFATIGYAPESWSPNSEYDQFFNEFIPEHYDLYNVRYVVTGIDAEQKDFYKLIGKFGKYGLWEVETRGWFAFGKTGSVVAGNKNDFINIVKYWLEYIWPKTKEYPKISYSAGDSNSIKLIDTIRYNSLYGQFNLWQREPFFLKDYSVKNEFTKISESATEDRYEIKFRLNQDCPDCILILKNTYHPNWQISVNGIRTSAFPVFPFDTAVLVTTKGEYRIEAVYRPGVLKTMLLIGEMLGITVVITVVFIKKYKFI